MPPKQKIPRIVAGKFVPGINPPAINHPAPPPASKLLPPLQQDQPQMLWNPAYADVPESHAPAAATTASEPTPGGVLPFQVVEPVGHLGMSPDCTLAIKQHCQQTRCGHTPPAS